MKGELGFPISLITMHFQVSQRLLHRYIPAGTSSLRRPPRTRVDDLLHRRRTPLLPLRRHSVAPSTYRDSRNDPSYIPVQSQSDAAPYKAAFLPAGASTAYTWLPATVFPPSEQRGCFALQTWSRVRVRAPYTGSDRCFAKT